LLEGLDVHAAARVVVHSLAVSRIGPAVPDVTSRMAKAFDQLQRLAGEGVQAAVPGRVQPPDLPGRRGGSKSMEHGEDRRRANPPAQEPPRPAARLKDEAARGLADIEIVPSPDLAAQELPAGAVRLELDAHPVPFVGDRTGERVAPEDRRALRGRSE